VPEVVLHRSFVKFRLDCRFGAEARRGRLRGIPELPNVRRECWWTRHRSAACQSQSVWVGRPAVVTEPQAAERNQRGIGYPSVTVVAAGDRVIVTAVLQPPFTVYHQQVSDFRKPASCASSSEQNQRWGCFVL
jgi:hypothetical protein